jgi:hypothetical protein
LRLKGEEERRNIQFGPKESDFLDSILITPSRRIKTMMKRLMRASSAAVGFTIGAPFTAFDN